MFKNIIKFLIVYWLTLNARIILFCKRPYIIAITGNVGKTTTKDFAEAIFKEVGESVRKSKKSYNSEFGVPLTILNLSTGENIFGWLYIVVITPFKTLMYVLQMLKFEKYLILEVGVEYENDMEKMNWLKPNVAVLTQLGKRPVHLENFSSVESLYEEKMKLLRQATDIIIHNDGDEIQKPYIERLKQKKQINYIDTLQFESSIHFDEKQKPIGTDVRVFENGMTETLYIKDQLGDGIAQACVIAATIAKNVINLTWSQIRRAIVSSQTEPGRMRIIRLTKGNVLIDDTYNASPLAYKKALDILAVIPGKKVCFLGKMAQLGLYTVEAHTDLLKQAVGIADEIFAVDFPFEDNKEMRKEFPKVSFVDERKDAIRDAKNSEYTDTTILIKGSQVARMETVSRIFIEYGSRDYVPTVRENWKE